MAEPLSRGDLEGMPTTITNLGGMDDARYIAYRLLATLQRAEELAERERSARHAAEAVNADEVLRARTNLGARIESLTISLQRAEAERDEAIGLRRRAEAALREAQRILRSDGDRHCKARVGQALAVIDAALAPEEAGDG